MEIDLLRAAVTVFSGGGHLEIAVRLQRCVVVLALRQYRRGIDRSPVDPLSTFVDLAYATGRMPLVAEGLIRLADLHRHTGDTIGQAEVLAELGATLHQGHSPTEARRYLTEALTLLTTLDAPPPLLHVWVIEQLGRVEWTLRQRIVARQLFTRARDLVGDLDPTAHDRLHALTTTPVEVDELPNQQPLSPRGQRRSPSMPGPQQRQEQGS